jgi:hypothetical protein
MRQCKPCCVYMVLGSNLDPFWNLLHTYITLTLYPRRGSRLSASDIPQRCSRFTKNYLAMSNKADGELIAVWSQSISGENAINPLVTFYDYHGRKRKVLFFYFVPDTTRDVRREVFSVDNKSVFVAITEFCST